jgi:hypothetical protein
MEEKHWEFILWELLEGMKADLIFSIELLQQSRYSMQSTDKEGWPVTDYLKNIWNYYKNNRPRQMENFILSWFSLCYWQIYEKQSQIRTGKNVRSADKVLI